MQIGTIEHKQAYFEDLHKQMRESIYFGEFQIWTIDQSIQKLQADKAEAEAKVEDKEHPAAPDKKALKNINDMISKFLFQRVNLEDQNKVLENRIIEIGVYVSGLKTDGKE